MVEKINLSNRNPNLHLRDARHAHNFYTENGHLFSPKTKFLYHVVFEISDEAGLPYTNAFDKEIGVLAKTCDLPQYRINVDTRKQYNRNRNFQTGINYEEVKIVFHDDNRGVTTAMLEEYYRYYYRDGNKASDRPGDYKDFSRTDLYSYKDSGIPRYGYDSAFANNNKKHFFSNIIIFQMARQKWTSYTLVNPLITALGHDTLDYSDGAGMMENTVSVAYEAVMYNRGDVVAGDEPRGFTDRETRYDNVFSPLVEGSSSSSQPRIEPTLTASQPVQETVSFASVLSQSAVSAATSITSLVSAVTQTFQGGIQGVEIPKTDTANVETVAVTRQPEVVNGDPDDLTTALRADAELFDTAVAQNLRSGNIGTENTYSLDDWNNLTETEKNKFREDLLTQINSANLNVIKTTSKVVGTQT